jgi:hypothetical protein
VQRVYPNTGPKNTIVKMAQITRPMPVPHNNQLLICFPCIICAVSLIEVYSCFRVIANSIRCLLNRKWRVRLAYFRDRAVITDWGIIRSFVFDVKCPVVFAVRTYALHFHHDSSFHSIIVAVSTPCCHHTPSASSTHPHKHWPLTPATC